MPRFPRVFAPETTQHLISRFINREYLLESMPERAEYLRHAGRALARTDWEAVAFGLMSSHTHWGALAGYDPSARLVQPLHSGFSRWLNRRRGRLGPVFADRHRSIIFAPENVGALVAYIHNNPCRAGLVDDPADSDWTSHRAFIGEAPAPDWLDVRRALALCGFDASLAGRLAFHEFVAARKASPRDPAWSGDDLAQRRAQARAAAGLPVDLPSPTVRADGAVVSDVLHHPSFPRPASYHGCPLELLRVVAEHSGHELETIRSRIRVRSLVHARRVALALWVGEFRRPAREMAQALGLSSGAASKLLSPRDPRQARSVREMSRVVLATLVDTDTRENETRKK